MGVVFTDECIQLVLWEWCLNLYLRDSFMYLRCHCYLKIIRYVGILSNCCYIGASYMGYKWLKAGIHSVCVHECMGWALKTLKLSELYGSVV